MSPPFLLFLLFLSKISFGQECDPWSYKDCDTVWPKCWRTCDINYYPLQDPVDIQNEVPDPLLGPAVFTFPDEDVILRHTDHTLSVVYPAWYTGGFSVNGKKYILQEFHFHTPSENNLSILGEGLGELDMEIHMVHKSYNFTNGTQQTAILSVLWQKADGYPHPWLDKILHNTSSIPHQNQSTKFQLTDLSSLFQDQQKEYGYWTIEGTLTTPPCLGNVTWYIMQVPLKCTKDQWKQFHDITGTNARPVQRKVVAHAYIPQRSHPAPIVMVGLVVGLVVVMSVLVSGLALYWHRRRSYQGIDRPTYERL